MTSFAIAHPWLTFWLAVLAMVSITNVVANICKTIVARKRSAP